MKQNIWDIFKEANQVIHKESLSNQNLVYFNDKMAPIANIVEECENPQNLSLLNFSIKVTDDNGNTGKFAFLYNAKTTLAFEYLMLMGQTDLSEDDTTITEPTVDANQELLQMILKKASANISKEGLGDFKFEIEEIKVLNSVVELELHDYNSYTTYLWEQSYSNLQVKETVFILLDLFTEDVFNPYDALAAEEESKGQELDVNSVNYEEENINGNFNADFVTIEIEDCDKKKRIYREELDNLRLLLDVELKLSVRIGSKKMLLKDVVNIDIGTTVELEQLASEPLEILVNEIKIAEGEIVVVEGKFGVQITKISSKVERLTKLRFKG